MIAVAGKISDIQRICQDYDFSIQLDKAEQNRINAIHSEKKRRDSTLIRKLLLLMIETRSLINKDVLHIAYGSMGKPFIHTDASEQDLFVNWSHCRNWLALVMGSHQNGVDIEEQRTYTNNLVERVLTNDELLQYQALNKRRQDQYFFERWVMKESFVKAEGQGIGFGIDRLRFKETSHNGVYHLKEVEKEWYLKQYQLYPDVHLGFCSLSEKDILELDLHIL
jgi:4'-phosphopantetheinyl transferase